MIVTRKDSKLHKLEDLKGKRFAFVDEKSTSGYLYPRVMFKKKKINTATYFKETYFAGNHQAAIMDVVNKKADAAAVFSDDTKGKKSAWHKFSPDTVKNQFVIWASEPIPNDPFCVRLDFYDKYPRMTHDLMFALIDLKDSKENLLKKLLGVNELMLATTKQYDPVREVVHELDLRLEQ
jgi:phosphonate transport system substrate-binding protein